MIFLFFLQNFLNNFHVDNKLMVAVRILLLFQLLTVFPMIMYLLRNQTLMLFSKHQYASYKKIYGINLTFLASCIFISIIVPSIGSIIRYSGSLCGAVVLFVLPCMILLADAKIEDKLTIMVVIKHIFIMILGIVNFGAQFAI